jgi:hypothetical protein
MLLHEHAQGIRKGRVTTKGCGAVGKGQHAFVEVVRIEESERPRPQEASPG